MASGGTGESQGGADCLAEELADALVTSRAETLARIEAITLEFLTAVASGEDPTLQLVRQLDSTVISSNTQVTPCTAQICRSEKNVIRDGSGHTHLGKVKTVKALFERKALGADRYAKSKSSLVVA